MTAQLWSSFEGKANTEAVLREKAEAAARLVGIVWDCPWRLASGLSNEIPGVRCGDKEAQEARAETAILLIHILCSMASLHLRSETSVDIFAAALVEHVEANLGTKRTLPKGFNQLLMQRVNEYRNYPEWLSSKDEGAKGTLFWEFGSKASEILGVGKHAFFMATLTNLLLQALSSWQLPALFGGETDRTPDPIGPDFFVEDGVIAYGKRGRQLVSAFYELIKGTLPAIIAAFDKRDADEGSYLVQNKDAVVRPAIQFCIACAWEPARSHYGGGQASLFVDALFARFYGRLPHDELYQTYIDYPILLGQQTTECPVKPGRLPGGRVIQFICDVVGHPDAVPYISLGPTATQFMLDGNAILDSQMPEQTAAELVQTFFPRLVRRLEELEQKYPTS